MLYTVTPTNKAAVDAVTNVADKIDGRLAIPREEKEAVAAYVLGHRHLDSFKLAGHQKVTNALIYCEVIGRAKGHSDYFVQPPYRDLQEIYFGTTDDGTMNAHPVSKSGLWFRSKDAALTLDWDDVARLGHGTAFLFKIVDFPETSAAFFDQAKPSVSFQHCAYHRQDSDAAQAFSTLFLEQARLGGVAVAPIKDGFVVTDPDRAMLILNLSTTKWLNRHGPRFAVLTKDQYGRQTHSWGAYQ